MRRRPVVMVIVVALLLYWVVNSPVDAAATIKGIFGWLVDMAQLVADRVVRFLNALT